ncbi:virulence-associated protein VagC [Bacillus mycoides]
MNYYMCNPYYPISNSYQTNNPINMYYNPYFNYRFNTVPIYPINEINSYFETNYLLDRQSVISLQNTANTQWKDRYLDIDGNTGQVILWPRLGSGGYWKLTDHGHGIVSLQNTANTKWKDHYLDIDANTGQLILWPRLASGAYWKLTNHGHGNVSLQNTANTKWKDHYLDIDANTGQLILWPRLASGAYWKLTNQNISNDTCVPGVLGKKITSNTFNFVIYSIGYVVHECQIQIIVKHVGFPTHTFTLKHGKTDFELKSEIPLGGNITGGTHKLVGWMVGKELWMRYEVRRGGKVIFKKEPTKIATFPEIKFSA